MEIQEILSKDKVFRYQLLSRLQMDCDFYLGNGDGNVVRLWADNEKEHIKVMKDIWNSFSDEDKPTWLSWDCIMFYERKMT